MSDAPRGRGSPLQRVQSARPRLLGLVLALATLLACAPSALAASCPGAEGPGCPYTSVQIVGQRGEGVLRFPEAVALDGRGDVYVADQLGFTVQEFTAAGAFQAQWGSYGGGPGQFGPIGGLATDAAGDVYVVDSSHDRIEKFTADGAFITSWGRRGDALGEFQFGSSQNYARPPGGGIAVAGDHVYVVDSGNDRVQRFNLSGGEPIAWGSAGSGPGQFSYPRGIAANEQEVIVSDDNNHRLERFSPEGVYEGQVGGIPGTGRNRFEYPYGVALDAAADVFVGDDSGDRIVELGPHLQWIREWGTHGAGPGQLDFPRAIAAEPDGETYVADTANDRLEVFDPRGGFLRTVGTSGLGPGELTSPRGLATDPTGRLLVSDDDGNRVEAFAPGSYAFQEEWTATAGDAARFFEPSGVAVDPHGAIYVADPGDRRVVRLWGEGAYLSEISGLGGASLSGASALAIDPSSGVLYVADSAQNRVLAFSPAGALVASWGASTGAGGVGELDDPQGVAVGPSGEIYVADTGHDRVVELSSGGSMVASWGGEGSGDGRLRSPAGVAVDAAGRVFVLDAGNDRVEEFSAEGRFLAKWGTRGVGPGEFSQPAAIAIDCSGAVLVADTNNNRVERFVPSAPAGVGCLPAQGWPPPLELAPSLHVVGPSASEALSAGAVSLWVSCDPGCRLRATGTLTPLGAHGAHAASVLRSASAELRALRTGTLRLRLGTAARRRLRRELRRGGGLRATVEIIAAGPSGRRTVRTLSTRTYTVGS